MRHAVVLIVLLATLVRFWHFSAPYTSQHWIKQLQIAPIAKNFYLHGYNILWPQTDYSADKPAYIEIEFQLVTFLTALLYNVFGIHEWVGRLVTIGFSVGSMILLYRLMLAELGPRPAILGLLFFAFAPSNWYFSRCLMSEPAMIFFSIATLYTFRAWLETQKTSLLALTIVVGALCFLVKLPAVLLFCPLLFLAYRRFGWGLFRRPALYLCAFLSLAPAVAYYLFARYAIGEHYFTVGVGFGGGMWFSVHDFLRPGNYSLMLQRLSKDHLTAVGLTLLPLGAFAAPEEGRPRWNLFHAWLVGVLVYLVVVSGGNIRQNYYQLPLIPAAAGLIGLVWHRLAQAEAFRRCAVPVLASAFLILATWGVQPMFKEYRPIRQAAAELKALDPSGLPVIILPPGYGCLYYFDRPGWCARESLGRPLSTVRPDDIPGPLYIESRRGRGAHWAVYFDVQAQEARPDLKAYLSANYAAPIVNKDYIIYDLTTPSSALAAPQTGAGGLP
jgi:4-amino-4-deoxy-L-arabinose transferase-like glycosyltransferase